MNLKELPGYLKREIYRYSDCSAQYEPIEFTILEDHYESFIIIHGVCKDPTWKYVFAEYITKLAYYHACNRYKIQTLTNESAYLIKVY